MIFILVPNCNTNIYLNQTITQIEYLNIFFFFQLIAIKTKILNGF